MTEIFELRSDLAKGVLAAIAAALAVNTQAKIDAKFRYGASIILMAFVVWFLFLIRASVLHRREIQYLSFWSCWKRPIVVAIGFLLPLIIFIR